MKLRTAISLFVIAGGAVAGAWFFHQSVRAYSRPEPGALVERVKEVARLQTLEVHLSTTVEHVPDPKIAPTFAGQVVSWVAYNLRAKKGRALVSGVARLSLDLSQLDASAFHFTKDRVTLVVPPVRTSVDIDLERTQIVASNLNSAETAELFEKGRRSLVMQVERNEVLQQRARASAQNALRTLLTGLGFREVVFVDSFDEVEARGS